MPPDFLCSAVLYYLNRAERFTLGQQGPRLAQRQAEPPLSQGPGSRPRPRSGVPLELQGPEHQRGAEPAALQLQGDDEVGGQRAVLVASAGAPGEVVAADLTPHFLLVAVSVEQQVHVRDGGGGR